jgi:hypothetical protein
MPIFKYKINPITSDLDIYADYEDDIATAIASVKKITISAINKTGGILTKGTVVYLKTSSSSTMYPEALKANASSEATSSKTIGVVYEDIAEDAVGQIVTKGEVENLNTSAYNVGDRLWLDTADGLVTTTKPIQPNHSVFVGTVTRSQVNNGRISYDIQNGFELDELHDVLISGLADGHVLQYENSSGLWKNKVLATGGLILITNQTTGAQSFYSTLEAARDAAVSGNTIIVFPGTYVVTTTATNGLSKEGVDYYFHSKTFVSKATAGDLFNETGFTVPCNVYGHGTFTKTTASGRILYNTTPNATFEALSCTSSIDTIFTTLRAKMKFKVDYATASAGYVLRLENQNIYSDSLIDINMIYWKSTSAAAIGSSNWWYYTTLRVTGEILESTAASAIVQYNGNVKLHLNIGQILGLTYGLSSGDGYGGSPNIVNCNYCTGIYDSGKPYILNGEFGTLVYSGVYTYSSYVQGGRFQNITLNGTGHVKTTLAGIGSSSVCTITQSSGVLDVDIDSAHYGIGFNITGGVCNILSYRTQSQLSSGTERIVNGGTLNVYAAITHGGGVDSGRWYAIKLQSGTLRLYSNIYNLFDQSGSFYNSTEGAHGIVWIGGDLIIENSTITAVNTLSYPIKSNTAGLQLRVNGRLTHNRTEQGSLLAGKKHKYKYIVNAVATTSIYCNDGTGGDEFFTETNTATYNTTALLAQRMAALINASGTLDLTATQDTPGTDAYFYLEHDTIGQNFSVYGNNNTGANLTASLVRIGSFPITELVGGDITGNSNVK